MIDCFVIGGGPSLRGFSFWNLPPAYRIGANKAAWLADCDAFITLDRKFWQEFRPHIAAFEGQVYVSDNALEYAPATPGAVVMRRSRSDGLSLDPREIRGVNSGYAGLNLAVLLGFRNIGLLGFDFRCDDTGTHFHDGYIWQPRATARSLATWARAFDTALDDLAMAGARVTNFVGPGGSNVTAFPTQPLESLT